QAGGVAGRPGRATNAGAAPGMGPSTIALPQGVLPPAGRTATPSGGRAGPGIEPPTTTFQPRVLSAAGRIATSIKRRVGEGTGMTNIPVGMIVASSTGPHARTIA